MDSVDQQVLKTSLSWYKKGQGVVLATIVQTWGSSPRPPGAMLAIRGDGKLVGSVSGGCIEDDLIVKIKENSLAVDVPTLTTYGVTKSEAQMFGLPCGGTLKIVLEPVSKKSMLPELVKAVDQQKLTKRVLNMSSGEVDLKPAKPGDLMAVNGETMTTVHGPRWKVLIIGAGQLSEYLAEMAGALDYSITVCDPREEYSRDWSLEGVRLSRGMPDDVVKSINIDSHTAVVALTHDPKLDDLALIEALKSSAFYIGALGSAKTSQQRRERLAQFDLSESELDRLKGPVGLDLGGKTPPEIAVAIMAEMTASKHRVPIENIARNREKVRSKPEVTSLNDQASVV